ncbi:M23 family metallopeptidase [Streptomyces sp. NPDC018045]|uniref:M23 family metallopeptidase n=1 Tax=Streptomyces sp. NPDC018045 TaxID=3365037 RepID=UPI00378CE01D
MASNSPAGSVPEIPFGAAPGASGPLPVLDAGTAGTAGAAGSAPAPDAAAAASGGFAAAAAVAGPGAFTDLGASTGSGAFTGSGASSVSGASTDPGAFAVEPGESGIGVWEEWNPTEDTVRPVRGKHRVAGRQRGGLARSGTVLGVGVIAAVGAGGMATAEEKPLPAISLPDVGDLADDLAAKLPDAESLPGIGDLIPDSPGSSGSAADRPGEAAVGAPLSQAGLTQAEAAQGMGAGQSLRDRILHQADRQQSAADQEERRAAEQAAAEQAARDAAAHQQQAEKAAAAKEAAEREARRAAEAAAREKAEAERRAELARSYVSPLTSYTLTAGYGQAGDRWAANHTGLDFAAPTGTPVKAVHGGTVTQAGWAGAYGYRVILTLADGTELWFCHLSSMVRTTGKVAAGEVIGRVGATGNVTGPHLHLEVRPGGTPVDPKPWLREHGLDV